MSLMLEISEMMEDEIGPNNVNSNYLYVLQVLRLGKAEQLELLSAKCYLLFWSNLYSFKPWYLNVF